MEWNGIGFLSKYDVSGFGISALLHIHYKYPSDLYPHCTGRQYANPKCHLIGCQLLALAAIKMKSYWQVLN